MSTSHTRIVTTIGPASLNDQTLSYFAKHSVEIARLNFSHGQSQWHIDAGLQCRANGLKLLIDLGGPKIRMSELKDNALVETGQQIYLEYAKPERVYPTEENGLIVLPTAVDLVASADPGRDILVDDGKLHFQVEAVEGQLVRCKVLFGGMVRSRKGINLPGKSVDVPFLTERDRQMLLETLVPLKPEIVACSFVRSKDDIVQLKEFIQSILDEHQVTDYFPDICAKIEQFEAVQEEALQGIIAESQLIMIARGDLALETTPVHVYVPFYQEKIKRMCRSQNKPFVVATQILESMIDSPVPTRAEISDLYRAVVIDRADYVMLSGESALGKFGPQCVDLMHTMIQEGEHLAETI